MKIEKAIEILPRLIKDLPATLFQEEIDAINLGIEALKYVRSQNDPDHQMMRERLPGED